MLVVDDYDANRVLLQDVLEMEGFRAFGACDGKDALRLLNGLRPSVILLDIKMPVLNGHELLFELRADQGLSTIPVVLVTADRDAGQISGVAALIKKPFEISHLVETVKRCAGVSNG